MPSGIFGNKKTMRTIPNANYSSMMKKTKSLGEQVRVMAKSSHTGLGGKISGMAKPRKTSPNPHESVYGGGGDKGLQGQAMKVLHPGARVNLQGSSLEMFKKLKKLKIKR